MTKVQLVQFFEWDGTPERYNEIVDKCFPVDLYQLDFVDDNFDKTNKITKCFRVFFMDNTYPRDKERAKKEYESYGKQHNGVYYESPCYIISPSEYHTEEESSES